MLSHNSYFRGGGRKRTRNSDMRPAKRTGRGTAEKAGVGLIQAPELGVAPRVW